MRGLGLGAANVTFHIVGSGALYVLCAYVVAVFGSAVGPGGCGMWDGDWVDCAWPSLGPDHW